MKKAKDCCLTAAGIILAMSGLYLVKTTDSPQAFWAALPYVCTGIGCGAFGAGCGSLLSSRILRKHPGLRKQNEINEKDERNIMIASRAKAKAYNLMISAFVALIFSFILMGMDMAPVLLLVFTYLLVQGYEIYCRCKYEKEM